MDTFAGKVAVVTGGGSGIGRGIARVLAETGMKVVIADTQDDGASGTVAEIEEAGGEALAIHTDVSKLESVQALADAAYDRFGGVHVLCNNAGVMTWQQASQGTHADWQWVIGINLWGVVHGVEVFLPRMLAQGGEGHIVNTASIAGVLPSAVSALYSTTKFAVVGLSETMSNELKETGIGVSVLCPGAVKTSIAESDRNRPPGWTPTAVRPPSRPGLGSAAVPLEPVVVGHMVLDAIKAKRLYIFTEPTLRPRVEQKMAALLSAFDVLTA
jgi:NAD(P)-dependent dehydrogenase (short-subunit alcohol dehydrogenase family)